ncbi:UDP-N-acetylmuramate--L-alanine ligase [Bacteroidota bacterium]
MRLEDIHRIDNIYMIGIGGIGMSALARYFLIQGKRVAGYDRVSTRLTDDLIREGSEIHFTADLSYIKTIFPDPDNILVIYTPAVPDNHLELEFFRKGGYQIVKRAEMLGILSKNERCIAVAGTHGKTTISTMIAHLLRVAGIPCNAFLGGISKNYQTNALLSDDGEWMVLEADEYDRSFLHLYPTVAIVSSCDPDHLDIYGSVEKLEEAFCEFIGQVDNKGHLVYRAGLGLDCLKGASPEKHSYSLEGDATYYAQNIRNIGGLYRFDAVIPDGIIRDIDLGIPGLINIENALACLGLAKILDISDDHIREAMASFSGVIRRFDVLIHREDLVYIDDYAHHPRELDACIDSVKKNYPNRKVTGIFQPHLFSRTQDLAEEFAESLAALDELILLDIYPARENPIEGVSSRLIYDRVDLENKILIEKEQLMQVLEERHPELLLTLGAGDIDQFVDPIVNLYTKQEVN